MRMALLGAGTIARLVLEYVRRGAVDDVEIVAVAGRPGSDRARQLQREFNFPELQGPKDLATLRPDVVVEAASHQALREHLVDFLDGGISVIVLSAGALADDALRDRAETAARRSGARLYVPSGGIGGLDALKAACVAGVDEVSIEVAKPPAAWKKIPYVEALGVDLDRLAAREVLYEGPARGGVPHFPQNVNIAAVLSLAGAGFDRTRLKVVADPHLTHNTHTIVVRGRTGRFSLLLENVPSPENPKTALLACYSALAAIREIASAIRYGT